MSSHITASLHRVIDGIFVVIPSPGKGSFLSLEPSARFIGARRGCSSRPNMRDPVSPLGQIHRLLRAQHPVLIDEVDVLLAVHGGIQATASMPRAHPSPPS